ncbi:MAG: RNA 2',3'-cyclic phosphodiesterase [Patescibacteria group bacterium]|nr:RNA 2',3'-cyclic phosphodiesterase [Patescibacteria group bacterium]
MKRLFIAISLPSEIKKELAGLQAEIKNSFPMEIGGAVAKWVAPENLHITLFFIGEAEDSKVPEISAIIQKALGSRKKLPVKISRICYGPGQAIPPRFVWLELAKNNDLERLAETLGQEIIKAGVLRQSETRPFSGHITLARIKEWIWRRIEPDEQPQIEKDLDLNFEVKSVYLMESHLKKTGPEYNVLSSFNLI